ncbi:MAG TPA: glycosyltransferase family 4 protein [Candidatus Lokiarchaeia archaeon]
MNILYFVNYFSQSTGAAALNSQKIVDLLTKYGHKLLILTPGNIGKTLILRNPKSIILDNQKFKIEFSNSLIKPPLSWIFSHYENAIKFLLKFRNEFSPDIILSQYHAFHYASVASNFVSKKLQVPHIIRSHDIFIDLPTHSVPYRLFNLLTYPQIYRSISKCKAFFVVSSELRDFLLKFKKLNKTPIGIHHNGIDTSVFHPIKNNEILKEKYGCETIISFIGLITEDIGLQNLVQIMPEVLKSHKDTHLLIIGEGSYKETIIKLVNKFKLNAKVHFLGVIPHNEIPFYINNCDIGIGKITPRKIWTYSVPVKCLEYMACNKPFISTPLSRDIIKNNDVGLIIKRNFIKKDIIDSLVYLLEDRSLRLRLGENGFNKINQVFRWDTIMSKFNDFLSTIKK